LAPHGSTRADIILLKSGQKLEGDVLKEQSDAIFVDVGVDVVRIPLDRIQTRQKSAEASPAAQEAEGGMYRTARLPLRSVKDLAERFGAGVVLVQTPGGLGSGFIINDDGYCVTNYHVGEREQRIAVALFIRNAGGEFSRRRIDDVKIVALNPFFDLALLQI